MAEMNRDEAEKIFRSIFVGKSGEDDKFASQILDHAANILFQIGILQSLGGSLFKTDQGLIQVRLPGLDLHDQHSLLEVEHRLRQAAKVMNTYPRPNIEGR